MADARPVASSARFNERPLLLLALGLFLVSYGWTNLTAQADTSVLQTVLQWFQVASGISFFIAAIIATRRKPRLVSSARR